MCAGVRGEKHMRSILYLNYPKNAMDFDERPVLENYIIDNSGNLY
jgi:hypothetical protein